MFRKHITILSLFWALSFPIYGQLFSTETVKIGQTLGLIDAYYVDSTNLSSLSEEVITTFLHNLDPHSSYISAKDAKETMETIDGNFDGIGISFNILNDTILVVEPIAGGPSEKVGIRAGDRIVTIDDENVAGVSLSTNDVRSKLMGAKGTAVAVEVVRRGEEGLLDFTIIRDKIPVESVDASYMIDKHIGYIKLNKFARTTHDEFVAAVDTLRAQGMRDIIIDLRNNAGGIMSSSTDIINHFFDDKRLMVYMEGRTIRRTDYTSKGNGDLTNANLVVLIDEGSASASEILSGAIQDWDRGVIVGRRSFGKGLVQSQFELVDGSLVRVTVARYYTPSGRLIQSPYTEGYENYINNYYKRFVNGELLNADNAIFPDSLKYTTLLSGRTVYGGGGITPDIFVPSDTIGYSNYYAALSRNGVYNAFVLEYADSNRKDIRAFKTIEKFIANFEMSEADIQAFIEKGEAMGVKYDDKQYKISEKRIKLLLKALVANHIWGTDEYFMIVNADDPTVAAAIEVLTNTDEYEKILRNN